MITLLCAACGKGGVELPDVPKSDVSPDTRFAAWQELLDRPGIAGTDYDPQCILVSFSSPAQLPAAWKQLPQGRAAPDLQAPEPPQPRAANPQLRRNPGFETLANALALRFGLQTEQQVYLGRVNFASYRLPPGSDGREILLRILAEGSGVVEGAAYCPLRHAAYIPNDPDFYSGPGGKQWSHWKIGCQLAWEYGLGDPGVVIAVVDTGVRLTHVQLQGQVINPEVAFPAATCDLANNDKSIEDDEGHGTFIAGTACAKANDDTAICGVAPGCRVLPIKISNDLAAPLDKLIAGALLAGELGARVVNYSWGGPQSVPLEQQMVDELTSQGVLFVCSAGNDGSSAVEYPSAFANALSVGASDKNDQRASFSNFHSDIDLAAPGVDMKACVANSDTGYFNSGEGTSFSTPMVAAGAALLWSYRPELSLGQVRAALEQQGPVASGFSGVVHRLDLAAALDSVAVVKAPSISDLVHGAADLLGAVPGQPILLLSVGGAVNVSRVQYRLDLQPPGSGPEDMLAESTAAPFFNSQIDLAGLPNQPAGLAATCFGPEDAQFEWPAESLWIFNQRGDVNADGLVNQADFEELKLRLGQTSVDPDFPRFADANLDGKINEADASALGYFYLDGVTAVSIDSVSPLNGYSGADAAFSAQLSGSGQFSFEWDFGGGALPNNSSLPAPTVTLAGPGVYSASLSVSNELGTVQHDFSLEVLAPGGPVVSFSADRSQSRAPALISFDASASFSPGASLTLFEWSWDGDQSYEESGPSPQAQHTFSSLGEQSIRLRVTDSNNASAEGTISIELLDSISLDSWQETVLGLFGASGATDKLRLVSASIGGCPALAWIHDDPQSSSSTLYIAVARVPAPQAIGDWRVDAVFSGSLFESLGLCEIEGEAAYVYGNLRALSYGRYRGESFENHIFAASSAGVINNASLAAVSDKPAVLFKAYSGSDFGGNLAYAYALGTRPDSDQDWNVDAISSLPQLRDPLEQGLRLGCVAGRPCFARELATGGLAFCYGASAAPGPADWTAVSFAGNIDLLHDYPAQVFDLAGKPALLFQLLGGSGWELDLATTDLASPALPGDFSLHQPDSAAGPYLLPGALLDGKPAFAIEGGGTVRLCLGLTAQPQAHPDWLGASLPPSLSGNCCLLNHAGQPALAAVTAGGEVVYRWPVP